MLYLGAQDPLKVSSTNTLAASIGRLWRNLATIPVNANGLFRVFVLVTAVVYLYRHVSVRIRPAIEDLSEGAQSPLIWVADDSVP